MIGQLTPGAATVNNDPDTRTISDRTLKLNTGLYFTALLIDPNGNLFVADGGNQRVLRFPASRLGAMASNMPRADSFWGQASFTELNPQPSAPSDKTRLAYPMGMAMDSSGRLYVCDSYSRVLGFEAPLFNGSAARMIGGVFNNIGILQPPTGQTLYQPRGIVLVGDKPLVIDTSNHRILRFKRYEDWPTDGTAPSADDVIGQASANDYKPNRDALWPVTRVGTEPAVSFNYPTAAAVAGDELFVADSGNNRVVVLPDPAATSGAAMYAKRVLGQQYLDDDGINRVEGRGFRFGTSVTLADGTYPLTAGMAVDTTSNPPRLYVADTGNNRILGFRDARTAKLGAEADLVIGQESSHRQAANWGPSNPGQPSEYGLNLPQGLAVDSSGNLWVADSGNGRVLRFPAPFAEANTPAPGDYRKADLVLGKPNFTATRDSRPDPSDVNFSFPAGIAFTHEGHLMVSDTAFHRVLLFFKPDGGFTSGMKASRVFGQPTFIERTPASSSSDRQRFNYPLQISVDDADRLFICDFGLDRLLLMDSVTERSNGTAPDTVVTSIGAMGTLLDPRGVYSSKTTAETWVAAYATAGGYGLLRISGTATAPDFFVGGSAEISLGVTVTDSGAPLVAQSTHRVAAYSPATTATNAANYEPELAPGMYATLWPFPGYVFPVTTALAPEIPLPKTLSGIQLLVNDIPAPLHYVSPGQSNFLVPQSAPISGDLDVKLVRQSTGEILAAGCSKNSNGTACQSPYLAPQASEYSVGIFTSDSSGRGQVRALNVKADGTYYGGCTAENIAPCLNSSSNPVKGGDFVELYLTGQGLDFVGTYEDGAAPGPGHTTRRLPLVYIGPQRTLLPESSVTYSGLSPYYPGLWQINIKIPSGEGAPYGNPVPLEVVYRSSDSWRTNKFIQSIAVTE